MGFERDNSVGMLTMLKNIENKVWEKIKRVADDFPLGILHSSVAAGTRPSRLSVAPPFPQGGGLPADRAVYAAGLCRGGREAV